jgi:hypothetical protein
MTFFSGTDLSELQDNAPLHNIYVSLIVNNANINCAKIAFLGKESGSSEINISYNDPDSGLSVTKVVNRVIEPKEFVYHYDCEINYPEGGAEDTLSARFQQLFTSLEKKRAAEEAKRPKYNSPLVYGDYGDYYGNNQRRDWNMPSSGEVSHPSTNKDDKNDEGSKNGNYVAPRGAKSKALVIPAGVTGKGLMKLLENDSVILNNDTKFKNTREDVYAMACKIISLDLTNEDALMKILKKMSNAFYPAGYRTENQKLNAEAYFKSVEGRMYEFYKFCFPHDTKALDYESTVNDMLTILGSYDTHFPELMENLNEHITNAITPNTTY